MKSELILFIIFIQRALVVAIVQNIPKKKIQLYLLTLSNCIGVSFHNPFSSQWSQIPAYMFFPHEMIFHLEIMKTKWIMNVCSL